MTWIPWSCFSYFWHSLDIFSDKVLFIYKEKLTFDICDVAQIVACCKMRQQQRTVLMHMRGPLGVLSGWLGRDRHSKGMQRRDTDEDWRPLLLVLKHKAVNVPASCILAACEAHNFIPWHVYNMDKRLEEKKNHWINKLITWRLCPPAPPPVTHIKIYGNSKLSFCQLHKCPLCELLHCQCTGTLLWWNCVTHLLMKWLFNQKLGCSLSSTLTAFAESTNQWVQLWCFSSSWPQNMTNYYQYTFAQLKYRSLLDPKYFVFLWCFNTFYRRWSLFMT